MMSTKGVIYAAISIHAPREGCDPLEVSPTQQRLISIHAPREGCDETATVYNRLAGISIHAPREGCDSDGHLCCALPDNFNPRTP